MVSKSSIKPTFIHSTIFETPEDCEANPFQFDKENLQTRSPQDIPDQIYAGYLLQIQVRKDTV